MQLRLLRLHATAAVAFLGALINLTNKKKKWLQNQHHFSSASFSLFCCDNKWRLGCGSCCCGCCCRLSIVDCHL